jgi:glycosyltransferase involved in cell wall biosynthesis
MKIAVHTIMLDEAAHIERWAASAADADVLILGDTGSTDDSVAIARDLGIQVDEIWVRPWRFDIARNSALALVPRDVDIVITVDCDEVLVPGWRDTLEASVAEDPSARRWNYHYVWSWAEPGVPDVAFTADRCYSREGWRWHGPVHEVLVPSAARGDLYAPPARGGFGVEHYADDTKSRSSYLELLELAVREEPDNPRQRFYLAREYFFVGRWEIARDTFVSYLAMPEATWVAERAEAYRYLAKMDHFPERWLLKALAEAPDRRDAVVDLVDLYVGQERWSEARGMATRALAVRERTGDYMTAAHIWDDTRLQQILDGAGRVDH